MSEGSGKHPQRIAFVTGGSGGIGRAVVEDLAGRGYTVAMTYCSNKRATEDVAAGLCNAELMALEVDVSDWDNVRERSRQQFTLRRGHVTIAAMPSFAGKLTPQQMWEIAAYVRTMSATDRQDVRAGMLELPHEVGARSICRKTYHCHFLVFSR